MLGVGVGFRFVHLSDPQRAKDMVRMGWAVYTTGDQANAALDSLQGSMVGFLCLAPSLQMVLLQGCC